MSKHPDSPRSSAQPKKMWGQPPPAVQSSKARQLRRLKSPQGAHNPETPHPQSPPVHVPDRTDSTPPTLPHAHTTQSDCLDAPPPLPASAWSPLSPSNENPSANRGRKSADTPPALHPANPPGIQTADNWA